MRVCTQVSRKSLHSTRNFRAAREPRAIRCRAGVPRSGPRIRPGLSDVQPGEGAGGPVATGRGSERTGNSRAPSGRALASSSSQRRTVAAGARPGLVATEAEVEDRGAGGGEFHRLPEVVLGGERAGCRQGAHRRTPSVARARRRARAGYRRTRGDQPPSLTLSCTSP